MRLLYTVSEVADMMGMSRRTVYNRISQGTFIKPRWIGRKPMFHIEDIKAFVDNLPRSGPGERTFFDSVS